MCWSKPGGKSKSLSLKHRDLDVYGIKLTSKLVEVIPNPAKCRWIYQSHGFWVVSTWYQQIWKRSTFNVQMQETWGDFHWIWDWWNHMNNWRCWLMKSNENQWNNGSGSIRTNRCKMFVHQQYKRNPALKQDRTLQIKYQIRHSFMFLPQIL